MQRYIVHGHSMRKDGSLHSFWTRMDLGRTTAYVLAREQRDAGGVSRVVRS